MLVKYKSTYRKIGMGLLSFFPEHRDLDRLLATMNEYETEPDRQLFLWKEQEGFIGLIGVKLEENLVQVTHVCVNPSHRNQGFGKRIVRGIQELYPELPMIPDEATAEFLSKYEQSLAQDDDKENSPNLAV
ncbi:GNAT family N-acetyltransferase [Neobacillus sp. Marseille-QA0830]